MREVMYDQSSFLIVGILFASMLLAIEAGYRLGNRNGRGTSEPSRAHLNALQASLLGILALLLGFTFSLSLQRFDSRSTAVVNEANAIGTAYLRAQLLPAPIRAETRQALRAYLDLRVRAGSIPLTQPAQRQALLVQTERGLDGLWGLGRRAVELDPGPVVSGLFIQSLNELIDAYGGRNAALERHVPELVLFLLYGAFLMTGCIIGYNTGITGQRASFVTYIMVALIVLLVFIIIDLDRPRRGIIEVSQHPLTSLQHSIGNGNGNGNGP